MYPRYGRRTPLRPPFRWNWAFLLSRPHRFFAGRVTLDGNVRPQLLEPSSADAADDEQIFDAAEWPALFAEVHDGFRRGGANSGQLLKFFGGGGVQVKRFRGKIGRAHV